MEDLTRTALATSRKAQEQLYKPNGLLDNAVAHAIANDMPDIAISPSQGAFLSILTQLTNPKQILEVGTLGGYSTIWFAEAVPEAQVTSLEFDPKHRDVALQNTTGQGLKNVDIRLGAALQTLPKLQEEGKVFDLVFIDADWEKQGQYFKWAVELTEKGGAIYVDNVVRMLTESDAEGAPEEEGWNLVATVKKAVEDGLVDATLIPTLSTHKSAVDQLFDGFVLAVKK
ncbi:S-adenosyl-L-methionine-dependent methyltransferase [Teratosphaeria nubilosa]|uniref:S-adenosyl-L-methionine-dependent methyltransferase n=1 Tax=Teratosphaeria nubilosa TaxID=161662 RepID=A0A6G1L5T2_9PEZI|nr:S-adenosyl-L-methionine-dependent methyltransferase [Teratosphaeria nubilosa]